MDSNARGRPSISLSCPGQAAPSVTARRRISIRQASSVAISAGSISNSLCRKASIKPRSLDRNSSSRKAAEIPSIDSAPTLKGNALELIERWKNEGFKNRYKPEEQLHRFQVLCRYVPRAVALPILLSGRHAAGSASSADAVRSQFFGVVLLSDISGFTQLAADLAKQPKNPLSKEQGNVQYADSLQKMGGERLATILNKVFSMFIDTILRNGGDVTKFAGDALLSVFRPSGSNPDDLTKCGMSAAKAALEMQTGMKLLQKMNINLELHSGLSAGMLHELHFGGFENRWEYMFAGQPIFEMGRALEAAVRGEVVIQSSVFELIKGFCQVRQRDDDLFLLESINADSLPMSIDPMPDLMHFLSQTKICKSVESALACYLPRSVTLAINAGKQGLIGERRQVTMVFINLPDFHYDTDQQIQANQSAFRLIQQALHRFDGTLRQLIQDDKGTVAIAAFGLPYNSHDDDAIRAVQASLTIQGLLLEIGMRTGIGVTTGGAFCGSVGDEIRCEYAIVGDIVNLSARLMVASHNGLLCDGETQRAALLRGGHSLNIEFAKMAPIKVKGRLGIVQVYHPAAGSGSAEQTLHLPATLMLGRSVELQLARSMFEGIKLGPRSDLSDKLKSCKTIMLIEADSGMGKTRLVQSIWEIAQEYEFTTLYFAGSRISDNADVVLWNSVLQRFVSLLCPGNPDSATSLHEMLNNVSAKLHLSQETVETLISIASSKPYYSRNSSKSGSSEIEELSTISDSLKKHIRAFLQLYRAAIEICGSICLVLENVRDLDITSGIYLSHLCRNIPRNMVIFLTSRPISVSSQMSTLDFQLRKLSYFQHVKLGPLSRRDTEALLCLRLHLTNLPDIVLDTVHKTSEGSPELIMDLATGLSEAKISSEQFSQTAMEIVQHMFEQNITSHIDRLSPSEQEILKCASVIGVTFALDLLQAISPYNNERLMENLVNLESKDVIVTTATLPVTTYAFRQPLMQKTVYGLLSKSDSSIYHNLIVDQLERLQQDRLLLGHLEAIPLTSAELAHHYQCAGQLANAIKYYRLAGDAAFSLGDFNGAASYSFKALSLLEQYTPNDRLEIAKLQRSSAKYLFENHEMARCLTLIEDSLLNIDSHVTSQSKIALISKARVALALSSSLAGPCRPVLPGLFTRQLLLERAKSLNMESNIAIELGNGVLAMRSATRALITSDAAKSMEQKIQAMTNYMMGALSVGKLMTVSNLYKVITFDTERDYLFSSVNAKPFSPFTKGSIYIKLAQVACAIFADAAKGRQFLKLASDKFTSANSPHHLVRTLDELASMSLAFLDVGEVEDVLQSMERIAKFCEYDWGRSRMLILRSMYHLITGNIAAAGQLIQALTRPNPQDDPKSALQYSVCRMIYDYYQDRPEQSLAFMDTALPLASAASYDLTNILAWTCQLAILRYKDLHDATIDTERRQVLSMANASLRALKKFAKRVPVGRPRALLVQGMFDVFVNRSSIWKATNKWLQALDLANQLNLIYDMALAHRLLGTMGQIDGSGLWNDGVVDSGLRAQHLAKSASLARQYDFCLILIPMVKGHNILTDSQIQRDPTDLSASATRDLRLQGYRQSNQMPISDIIDEGYGGENEILLSGLDTSEILVGRDHQLQTLTALYQQQSPSSISPVILYGSSGFGKSAIAKRFLRIVTDQNQNVKAFTMYGESSYKQQIYLPVIRVLRKMISEYGKCLGITSVSAVMEMLFNRLPKYLPFRKAITHMIFGSEGLSDAMLGLLSELSRAQILAIIFSDLLRTIAGEFNICLLIEDIQWLDTGTWHVLSSYASSPDIGVFILGTLQIDDPTAEKYIEEHSEVRHLLSASTHWIHVPPLERSDVLRLSCRLLSAIKIRSGLEILLIKKSGGSPLRLTDVLLCLQEDRLIQVTSQSIADLVVEPVDALFAISGSSVDLVKKRMNRLTKPQQNLLRLASVIGVSFPFNILRSLGDQHKDIDEFKSDLMVLKNRGWLLLAHMRTSSPRISFPHSSIQRDVYSTLDRESRNKFHVDLAEYYEGGSSNNAYVLPLIGRHYSQTNQTALDRKFNGLAATQFSFLFMINDAIELFYRCIDLDQKAPTYNHQIVTAGNWLNIAWLHLYNQDPESAKPIILRALDYIGANIRPRTSIAASIYWAQIALMSCQSIRKRPPPSQDQITQAALYETLSYVELRLGDSEAAHWAILQALTMRDSSSADVSARRYCWLLKVLCDRALLTNNAFLDLIVYRIRYWIRRSDEIRTMALCYNLLGQSAGVCGYWRSSINFASSALQLYDEILYDVQASVVSLQRLGVVHYISGRVQPSVEAFNRAEQLAKPIAFFHPSTALNCSLLIALHQLMCSQMNPAIAFVADIERLLLLKPASGLDSSNQAFYSSVEAVLRYKTGDFASAYHAAVNLRKACVRVDLSLMIAAPIAAEILVFILRQFRTSSGSGLEEMFGIQRRSVIAQAEGAVQLLYKVSETITFARTYFLLWHAALLSCKSSKSIDVLNLLQLAQRSAAQYAIPSVEALSHMFMAEIYEDKDQNRKHAREHARKAFRLFVETGARCHQDYIRNKFNDLQLHASPETLPGDHSGGSADLDEFRQDNESLSRHATHLLNIGRFIHSRITFIQQNTISAIMEKVMQPDDDVPDMNTFNPVPIFEEVNMKSSSMLSTTRLCSLPLTEESHGFEKMADTDKQDIRVYDGKSGGNDPGADETLLDEWDLSCCKGRDNAESHRIQAIRQNRSGIYDAFRDLRSGLFSGSDAESVSEVDRDYAAILPRPVVFGAICTTSLDQRDHLYGQSTLLLGVILNISISNITQDTSQLQNLFSTFFRCAQHHQGALLDLSFNRFVMIWDMTPTFNQSVICAQAVNCAFQMKKQLIDQGLGELFQCKFCLSCDDCILLDTVGPDCARGYVCIGPAVSEAFRIEPIADSGQIIVHKNLLKLLRISGKVVVKQEFDDKRCAILQSFASSVEIQQQRVMDQVIRLGRQHHIFYEDDQLIKHKFSKQRHGDISDPANLHELIVIAVRVDIPTDPVTAHLLVSTFAFEMQTIRLSEPSCVFASMSSNGMRLMAVVAFQLDWSSLAFLFAFRIRTRMCGEFGTECSVGIGTGLCSCRFIDPLAIPIILGDAVDSALLAVSLATNQIITDEVTQETFDQKINTIEFNSGDNLRLLRTSILLSGRIQLRAMLQETIIRDQSYTYCNAGQLFLIAAADGVGKTSLMSQIHRVSDSQIQCTRQDIALTSFFCSRKRSCQPGYTIKVLIRQYLRYVYTHQFGSLSVFRSRLVQCILKLGPNYLQLLSDIGHICDLGLDRRSQSSAAPKSNLDIAQILTVLIGMTLNDRKRIVMMIDDIDMIDELSVRCLDEMLGQLQNLIVIATCSTKPEQCTSMFNNEFEREMIYLPQMSHEDVALLACLRLGGMTPSHLFVDFVFRAAQMTTSSNLAVLCFCASRLCYASRRIAEANARSSGDRINQIITDGLTKSQSTVLAVCSVIGSKFDMDLLLVVLHALSQKGETQRSDMPTTPAELMDALQILSNQLSLLVQLPSPEGRKKGLLFAFRSEETEQKIYTSLDMEYKRRLHGLVAEALEQVHVDDDEALAGHWRMARHFDRSMHYQVKAARRYRKSQKLDQAITFYRVALSSGSLISKRRSSLTSQQNNGSHIRIEIIYLELAECLLITEQNTLAIETVTLALKKIAKPVPTGHGLITGLNKIRHWLMSIFRNGIRRESLNRVSPDIVPGTETAVPLSTLNKSATIARLYLAYAQACIELRMFDEGLDAALRALDLCEGEQDDVLTATVSAVASEFFIWKGWVDLGQALIDHCRPYGVVTVQSAVIDIVRGKFALAEPKLRSCSLSRILSENPTLARRLLLVQIFLAILQEDQVMLKSSLATLERICHQHQLTEASRHQAVVLQALMALQRHQLDKCTELLLDNHHTDYELPIAGQAILSLVFLRMGQISKAAAWFGTLFLEYSAESHLRTWYDLFDHVLVAEYLVEILIDDPRRRPRQQPSVAVSPTSRKSGNEEKRRFLPVAEDEDLSEAKRNLAVVVRKLREFSSRYQYTRGIAELYAGCLELVDTKSDQPDRFTTNLLQKAVSILEATDMHFFDARARFIIGSHNGFGDDRDHDMLLDARQYFSLSQNQHYLELVDEALQRRPLADLFSRHRFKQDRVMPDIVIEAMTSAFTKRTGYSTAPRINVVGADSADNQAGESDYLSSSSNEDR